MKLGYIILLAVVVSVLPSLWSEAAELDEFSPKKYYHCDLSLYEGVYHPFMNGWAWDKSKPLMTEAFRGYAHHHTGALATYTFSSNQNQVDSLVFEGRFSTSEGGVLEWEAYRRNFVAGKGVVNEVRVGYPTAIRGEAEVSQGFDNHVVTTNCRVVDIP